MTKVQTWEKFYPRAVAEYRAKIAAAILSAEADARKDERERCAKVAEYIYDNGLGGVHQGEQCVRTAAAIRAGEP